MGSLFSAAAVGVTAITAYVLFWGLAPRYIDTAPAYHVEPLAIVVGSVCVCVACVSGLVRRLVWRVALTVIAVLVIGTVLWSGHLVTCAQFDLGQ
jgi:hypothetical protein